MSPAARPSVACIGFGEAGRALALSLAPVTGKFSAYDILIHDPMRAYVLKEAADRLDVRLTEDAASAALDAPIVVSAVTAANALEVARAAAAFLERGQIFLDINSVSPATKQQAAEAIERTGARYVDVAVMGPIRPRGHRTPILIAGRDIDVIADVMRDLGFALEAVGEQVGAASAIKMVRSVFLKGFEAITVECLLAARRAGVTERVLASLRDSFPELGWDRLPGYLTERVARHGVRRAEEMREVALTLESLGLEPTMTTAAAELQARIGALGSIGASPQQPADLLAEIDRLLTNR